MAEDSGMWVKVYPEYAGGGGAAVGSAVIDSAVADDPDNYPVKTSSYTGDGTNGEDGQAYDVYEFLGSGELVVSEAGIADVVVVGSGGGGGSGGVNVAGGSGGAGGYLYETFYLSDDTCTVKVGAGGAANAAGNISRFNAAVCFAGGAGANAGGMNENTGGRRGGDGASGGGGTSSTHNTNRGGGGSGIDGQGNRGNQGGWTADPKGEGGGAGGTPTGLDNWIVGSSVTYAVGGGGGANGVANSGNGGARGVNNSAGGNGGSGIVIVRVKVAEKSFGDRTRSVTPKTAHAARIEDGVVREVITIPHLDDDDNKITEYCKKIGLPGTWVDTSYTGARRGKYAGVGDLFDPNLRNAEFVSPVETSE